jgi:hydrogenase expression/formation protein HypD
MLEEVFEPVDRVWRGLDIIPMGGLGLREAYRHFDAVARFETPRVIASEAQTPSPCRAGEVLMGVLQPQACPEFGRACTPETPLGAPMVSSEGACAAYYHYGQQDRQPV